MQLSQIPLKFFKAFGANASAGNIRPIPLTTSDPDAASQTIGWPPSTFAPEGAGGVPPDGRDMNGVMNQMSAWDQWLSAGGYIPYDATFQAAIGGYMAWSLIGSGTNPGTYWQSTVDNNLTNPDTGGSGWQAWPSTGAIPWASPPAIGLSTPNLGKFTNLTVVGNLNVASYIDSGVDLQISGVGFSQSFGTNLYNKLPCVLIIQSGRFFSPTGNNDSITFPLTFPSSCALSTSVSGDASNNNQVNVFLNNPTFNGFKCWTRVNGTITAGVGVGWTAIGW